MIGSIQTIPYENLALAFIPVLIVIIIMWRWKLPYWNSVYAVARMLIQLLLIGFVLIYIFKAESYPIVIAVLTVMLISSSWIALRTVDLPKKTLYMSSFLSIFIGGTSVLILITQFVLQLDPWYLPSYSIPLAGMIYANAMNSVSLAGERLQSELSRGELFEKSKNIALRASLIPITNALFAVGLVSLPGMMTGQILSGVSPFIAARYQIMVMCMVFGSAGISSALFLIFSKQAFSKVKKANQ